MNREIKEKYVFLAEFLEKTLGSEYEIVLYDFDNKVNSIVYLANGHISGRDIEDPLDNTTFKYISDKTISENNYIVSQKGIKRNGKVIKSSSLFIKDDGGNFVGMLCINFDGSKYVNLAKKILRLTNMENASIESESLDRHDFPDDVSISLSNVTDDVFDESFDDSDIPVSHLKQEEKIEIVRKLNEKGVFMLKGAVSEVAEKLQVSEATLYRYIRIVNDK